MAEDFSHIVSRAYRPSAAVCCERCCFNTGEHAEFCENIIAHLDRLDAILAEDATEDANALP